LPQRTAHLARPGRAGAEVLVRRDSYHPDKDDLQAEGQRQLERRRRRSAVHDGDHDPTP
jgi:hypothetical protein